ncbi:T9SS type A sorting domain-containing protein [Ascidiimonas aurantiaca]|uniref:T9SS type A sorting domain-containing protein n=1 Tax=Ascidiimonas aurantiaca TaxID=1685432 RepID=UPI0030ED607A
MKRKLLSFLGMCLALAWSLPVFSQSLFINEIHYDNASTDVDEAIEIAGPAGTDLTGYSLVLYNGSNGLEYNTTALSGVLTNQQGGIGTLATLYPVNGIQNGAPDGIALIGPGNVVIQFLSYEGSFQALDGPAAGITSTDIGVAEIGTAVGTSLQLGGSGTDYTDFTWEAAAASTYGNVNTNQTFGTPEPVINEFVFNHTGSDTDEFVEVLGAPNTDLSAYTLLEIEGDSNAPGVIDEVITLGTTNASGYWTTGFQSNAFENGTVTLLLVKDFTGTAGSDLDTNDDGTPDNTPWSVIADAVGVNDGGAGDINYASLVLAQGFDGSSFTVGGASRIPDGANTGAVTDWVRNSFGGAGLPSFPTATANNGEAINTPGATNEVAQVVAPITLIINEVDADTAGVDTQEFIELFDGGTGNTSLSGFVLVLYNGSSDTSYRTIDLSGFSTDANGYFVAGNTAVPNVDLVFPDNTLQNGADAVALYQATAADFPNGTLVTTTGLIDALVYDTNDADDAGLLVLLNSGEAQINEDELGNKDAESLQRTPNGTGGARNTSTYIQAIPTPGAENGGTTQPGQLISIAQARAAAQGTTVTVTGVLTVSDQFGGSAYIQDNTGGIAVFDQQVHGNGVFAIGDSLTITGVRSTFNDQVQLSQLSNVTFNGVATQPIQPRTITLSQLGDFPGELVRIVNPTFPQPGSILFGNANFLLTDTSGNGELRIDIDVADLVGLAEPASCGEAIGVVGRFRNIFQLLPRQATDLSCAGPYVPPGSNSPISKDDSFDVVTWNIEWFGDEGNSPAAGNPLSDPIQRDSVLTILQQLDADVYAVQEIADDTLFAQLVAALPGYDFVLSDAFSNPTGTPPFQKLGFIYKTATVSPKLTRAMLTTIHPLYNGGDDSALVNYPSTTTRFFASGRLPFLMTADVTINGVTEEISLINLHARANSSSESQNRYDMRKYDVEVLKDSLDVQFASAKFVLLGDYNDDVDQTVANITSTISSFEEYVNDTADYTIVSDVLSAGGFRSFVFRENMIDHIAISNELDSLYIAGSATVHYEVYDNDYTFTASDHFPVSARLLLQPLAIQTISVSSPLCAEDTATATVEVTGGAMPYTYIWDGEEAGPEISGLEPGEHTLTVTDVTGTSVTRVIIITAPEAINLTVSEDTTVFKGYAPQACTTLETLEISGGTAPYTYTWSNGATGASVRVCPEETTVYDLTVTDANGCTVSASITVEVEDVSCGRNPNNPKVEVCFRGRTLCISRFAVPSFLSRGATLGNCQDQGTEKVLTRVLLFPNPATNQTHLFVHSKEQTTVAVLVYDFGGRTVLQQLAEVTEGKSAIPLDLTGLQRGFYYVKPTVNGVVQKTQILIKR